MDLYSVRMRSSRNKEDGGRSLHISGGERIVEEVELEHVSVSLIRRAMEHENGDPDYINVSIDLICREDIASLEALPIQTFDVNDVDEGLCAARRLLLKAGVSLQSADYAIETLKDRTRSGRQCHARGCALRCRKTSAFGA